MQALTGYLGQMLLFHYQREFVEYLHVEILEHVIFRNVAELGDLAADSVVEGKLGAADDDVRLDSHALQILDAGLGGLCL